MTNNSQTGGVLLPAPPSPPLEGQALNRFLQQWLAGVSGLAGKLFFPRWQPEPPNIPNAATAWAAFGITRRVSDKFPYRSHIATDIAEYDQMQRHETLELLTSFYDLGTNGEADFYASQLRDGAVIAQNNDALTAVGYAMAETGDLTPVPTLTKERWLYRVDLPIHVRRCITRSYPIYSIDEVIAEIIVQDPAGRNTIISLDFDLPS